PVLIRNLIVAPGKEMFAALTLKGAGTGNRHVALPIGVDQRRIVPDLRAFPAGEDQRQGEAPIRAESNDGALGNVQFDMALKVDRTVAPPQPSRNFDPAAASIVRGANRRQNRWPGVVAQALARAKAGDNE